MTERVDKPYQPLFEVQILHHYWLDDANVLFDTLSSELREQHLLSYDVRKFLSVTPTITTQKLLNSLRCVFKNTALGFLVMIPKQTVVADNALFEFVLTVNNSEFFNYTALTFRPQKIVELYQPTEKKSYRYKENVTVLSNLTGVSRVIATKTALFLSKEIPLFTGNEPVESLVQISKALVQLTRDQSKVEKLTLSAKTSNFPAFVHQDDAPSIVPRADLDGTPPAKGILLANDIPDDVFALIRLSAIRADDSEFSFIDKGLAKKTKPVFQVRFKNRSTQWHYYNKRTGKTDNPTFTEPTVLPLTFFGNASSFKPDKKIKPSEGFVKAEFANNDPTKVLGLISEIFE
jgi:hypothetical protein